MKKLIMALLVVCAAGLVVANAILVWQGHACKRALTSDLRGIYGHPGIGAFLVSTDLDGLPVRSPLTLAIFFSAESECYDCLTEVASYKRLDSVFCERGQMVVAVTMREDSAAIDSFLHAQGLKIPLVVSRLGLTFAAMGMYPNFMPFKVLFDSTLTMIYMSGANNTPESQADFEAAIFWLSGSVHSRRSAFMDN